MSAERKASLIDDLDCASRAARIEAGSHTLPEVEEAEIGALPLVRPVFSVKRL